MPTELQNWISQLKKALSTTQEINFIKNVLHGFIEIIKEDKLSVNSCQLFQV